MASNRKIYKNLDELRRLAEDVEKEREERDSQYPMEMVELIEELKIHQTELEIQNQDLRRAQEEISRLHQEYENLYEFAPCGYLVIGFQGNIVRCNQSGAIFLDKKHGRLVSQTFSRFLTEESRNAYFDALSQAEKSGRVKTLDLKLRRDEGSFFWVRADIQAEPGLDGRVKEWRLTLVDISEQKKAEEELSLREEKYRALMEQSLDMIFLHDLEGNFLEVNQAAVKSTGYSRDELLNMGVFDLHPEKTERRGELTDMWARWRPGESIMLEYTHLDSRGRKYPVEINTGKVRFGNKDYILATVRDISRRRQAEEDLKESRQRFDYLLQSTSRKKSFHNIIGRSSAMQRVYALLQQVAGVDTTVLITGETGTGKELVAEALHAHSTRKKAPLIKVNCLTLTDELLDSELFGHVKGAFTGAYANKIGRVEAAQGGTLFLDEIGDLTPRIQLKLLRFLQQKEYERVGESITRKADVRIVAATNADLARKMEEGAFRKDLYFRIKVLNIHIPPLRDRTEDIPLLMDHFRRFFSEKFGRDIKGFSTAAVRAFVNYSWPGNVRELEHFIERASLVSPSEIIEPEHFDMENTAEEQQTSLSNKSGKVDREDIVRALEAAGGKKTDAARILGMSRRTLYRKLHEFGMLE